MKSFKKVVVLALLLTLPSVLTPLVFAENRPYTGIVILRLGEDEAITYTSQRIESFLENALVFSVHNLNKLQRILQKTIGYIIYIGHGSEAGLTLGPSIVSWKDITRFIDESPSPVHLLASCFSKSVQVSGKFVYGFGELVDVDEAAMWVTLLYYGLEQRLDRIPEILEYFTKILINKVTHPEESFRAFLGYYIKSVRGIWHVKWNDQYGYYVKYTHPDTYQHYTWIGVESSAGLTGNNLAVSHIPKWVLDSYDLASIIAFGLAAVAVGSYLAGLVGFIVGAIIFLVGLVVSLIVDWYIRDEMGAGWQWQQNWWSSWYGSGSDFKIGSIMWMSAGSVFGYPYWYPLWYGGRDLGIDGM